ncbi:GDP-L-fucose synthase [Sphingomonas sp. BK235]|uniref:GDP-L-fucose synthase family protein n=1 Tax=Sphingomonas sp. BK235 TaxID=2512131 RepID=UPI0010529245|nr:GDP-L-fucose synthase [Sphingomonas sp. BK235]TCP29374.1 GDP-L-fucose synthase [Sphingomonas sp. BK235]
MSEGLEGRIFLAGHRGLVGSAIHRLLTRRGIEPLRRTRSELDLLDVNAVRAFMASERPDIVILAAAKVGGIHANASSPATFIRDNLVMQCNVIDEAFKAGVKRLLFLGSSCIYPKHAEQPMRESALLTGVLEPSNEPYAIAKIAGIKMCESYNRQYGVDYRSVMPTNLYGPGDNFHPQNSHVLPALLRRFDEAVRKGVDRVEIWGTGTPRREFLHVDDMAAASLFVLELDRSVYERTTDPMLSHVNVGFGDDVSIAELAALIADVTGYRGAVVFDPTKPDGTPRKLLDVGRLSTMGWQASIPLRHGVEETYRWFLSHRDTLRSV